MTALAIGKSLVHRVRHDQVGARQKARVELLLAGRVAAQRVDVQAAFGSPYSSPSSRRQRPLPRGNMLVRQQRLLARRARKDDVALVGDVLHGARDRRVPFHAAATHVGRVGRVDAGIGNLYIDLDHTIKFKGCR